MTFGVIGFGRFGKFFSQILKQIGDVSVYSRRDVSYEAKQMGIVQRPLQEVAQSDYVFFATAISEFQESVKKTLPYLTPKTCILDVCSVKIYPCRVMHQLVLDPIEIIGTHPLFGPDSASEGLSGLPFVFCPVRVSKETLQGVKEMFSGLGLKIIFSSPEEHDRQSARSLALVHFLGRGLEEMGIQKQEITTAGYQFLLKMKNNVVHDSWRLFQDMHRYNPYAQEERRKFLKALHAVDEKLLQEAL